MVILVVAIGAVVAVVAYRNMKEKQECCTEMAQLFLQMETGIYTEQDRQEMLQGKGTFGQTYLKWKEDPVFIKVLEEEFSRLLADPTLAMDAYAFTAEVVGEDLHQLEEANIQSESIRQQMTDYYAQKSQEALDKEGAFRQSIFTDLSELAAIADAPYYLPEETVAMVTDTFWQQVTQYVSEGKMILASNALRELVRSDAITADEPGFFDLIESFLDACPAYLSAPGCGGYYDGQSTHVDSHREALGAEGMPSIGAETTQTVAQYYGDFCVVTTTVRSHVDGLLDAASRNRYNTKDVTTEVIWRDQSAVTGFDSSAVADGARYAVCYVGDDGELQVLFQIGPEKIYWEEGGQAVTIAGDFHAILSQLG